MARAFAAIALSLGLAACSAGESEPFEFVDTGASFSSGPAETVIEGLIDCGEGSRPSNVGTITAEDGTDWTVPADTAFADGPKASDLYNECANITNASLGDVDLASVPVMDAGGEEEFKAFVFADNYFELYVNGTLVGVDSVPFTPFNSSVVRFKAQRPLTLAFKLVDWEENLALGSEAGRGKDYQPGDGGLVAVIKDSEDATIAITDSSWKAQTFYTSPLVARDCLTQDGNTRDSSRCDTDGSNDGMAYSAAFWAIPDGWLSAGFDDSDWPQATTYTNDTIGVDNKPGYTNFTDVFDAPDSDAEFIWSSNVILDNLVLVRTTVE